ncbi:hypothetical protein BKA69DRAFT_541867 [Paraphysoderma sedebokerense]|nr:hypothetical protein BKA69DRAFT_541867 [Paraphysoderma sedebokerense]
MSPKFYTATEAFSGILNATSGLKLRDCARKSTTKCINSEIEETSDDEIDLYDPDTTWSSESVAFKQFLKRLNSQRQKPSRQQIYSFFTSLRLNDRKINQIDSEFLNLSDLIELSLTGNYLDSVQSLPSNIEVLHLNANRLTLLPHLGVLNRLVHLGLSHNFISSPMNGTAKVQIPDSLISVDLSYNSISNLYEWTETLKEAKNLRLLTLMVVITCFDSV